MRQSLGIASFYTVDDLRLALDNWSLPTTYIYGPGGRMLTGFSVHEITLTDGSKVRELHFMCEPDAKTS